MTSRQAVKTGCCQPGTKVIPCPSYGSPKRQSAIIWGESSFQPLSHLTELPGGASCGPPEIQDTNRSLKFHEISLSKIQKFWPDFGIGRLCSHSYLRPLAWILDFGFWAFFICNPSGLGFWSLDFGFCNFCQGFGPYIKKVVPGMTTLVGRFRDVLLAHAF